MKRTARIAAATAALVLTGGCSTSLTFHVPPPAGVTDYVTALLKPVTLVGVGLSAFRLREGHWPASVREIAELRGADENWRKTFAALADVVIEPQPDGSFALRGTMQPPVDADGKSLTTPIRFTATITLHPKPVERSDADPAAMDAKILEARPEAAISRP